MLGHDSSVFWIRIKLLCLSCLLFVLLRWHVRFLLDWQDHMPGIRFLEGIDTKDDAVGIWLTLSVVILLAGVLHTFSALFMREKAELSTGYLIALCYLTVNALTLLLYSLVLLVLGVLAIVYIAVANIWKRKIIYPFRGLDWVLRYCRILEDVNAVELEIVAVAVLLMASGTSVLFTFSKAEQCWRFVFAPLFQVVDVEVTAYLFSVACYLIPMMTGISLLLSMRRNIAVLNIYRRVAALTNPIMCIPTLLYILVVSLIIRATNIWNRFAGSNA